MFESQEDSPFGVVQDKEFHVIKKDSIRCVNPADLNPVYVDRVTKLRSVLPVSKPRKKPGLELDSIYNSLESTPVYQRTLLRSRGEDHSVVDADDFDNAVSFDPEEVKRLQEGLNSLSAKVVNKFNKSYLPARMSFDQASAAIEGFMRDGFGLTEFSLDTDMSHHLDSLVKLDMMWRYANSIKMAPEIRKVYFERLANSLFELADGEAANNRRRAAVARYSQNLNDPVGKPMANSVGTIRYASKKEVS